MDILMTIALRTGPFTSLQSFGNPKLQQKVFITIIQLHNKGLLKTNAKDSELLTNNNSKKSLNIKRILEELTSVPIF